MLPYFRKLVFWGMKARAPSVAMTVIFRPVVMMTRVCVCVCVCVLRLSISSSSSLFSLPVLIFDYFHYQHATNKSGIFY